MMHTPVTITTGEAKAGRLRTQGQPGHIPRPCLKIQSDRTTTTTTIFNISFLL